MRHDPISVYYIALNKTLNSDWLSTNLTLGDAWLAVKNVRLVAIWKRISHSKRDRCQVSSNLVDPLHVQT